MSFGSFQIEECTRDDWNDVRSYKRHSQPTHCKRHIKNEQVEEVMNVVNENRHKLSNEVRSAMEEVISIGATCVAEIDGRFFLLVEIEIDIDDEEIEQVIIFRITEDQAEDLLEAGVERCRIVTRIPTARPGQEVELICVFVVGNFAFLVFDVENATDELVLVRVPRCPVI